MKPAVQSPYLTPEEACHYMRWERADGTPNLNCLYIARCRRGLKAVRRGGRLLFRKVDLDAFMEVEADMMLRSPVVPFQRGASR